MGDRVAGFGHRSLDRRLEDWSRPCWREKYDIWEGWVPRKGFGKFGGLRLDVNLGDFRVSDDQLLCQML